MQRVTWAIAYAQFWKVEGKKKESRQGREHRKCYSRGGWTSREEGGPTALVRDGVRLFSSRTTRPGCCSSRAGLSFKTKWWQQHCYNPVVASSCPSSRCKPLLQHTPSSWQTASFLNEVLLSIFPAKLSKVQNHLPERSWTGCTTLLPLTYVSERSQGSRVTITRKGSQILLLLFVPSDWKPWATQAQESPSDHQNRAIF